MGLFRLIKVEGDSMARMLPDGSFALFRAARRVRPGQTVLVQHPRFGRIVKQVTSCTDDGIGLRGLNMKSTSAEDLGRVPLKAVEGVLLWSLKPRQKLGVG